MSMVTNIKTKLIILIIGLFWVQLISARSYACTKDIIIPKEIKALKLLTANFVQTNDSIKTLNKYNKIFAKSAKKTVLDYSLEQHINILIDINTNIQLSNHELSKIQEFIQDLNKKELDERLVNNINILKKLVEFRLIKKNTLLDDSTIQSFKEDEFETLLRYFSVYTQKGLIGDIRVKTKSIQSERVRNAINYSEKKSKFLNLLNAKNINLQKVTQEIRKAINENLLVVSHEGELDWLKYDYTIWLIKQLGLHLNDTKEILLNLKSDIWFYNQKELQIFIKEHRVIYTYGKIQSYALDRLGYFVKSALEPYKLIEYHYSYACRNFKTGKTELRKY